MSLYLGTKKIKTVSVLFVDGDTSTVRPENIKDGISILGIEGEYTQDGTQSTGYTVASSDEILNGYSAWAEGSEVLGTLEVNKYYYGSTEPASTLGNNGDIYLKS